MRTDRDGLVTELGAVAWQTNLKRWDKDTVAVFGAHSHARTFRSGPSLNGRRGLIANGADRAPCVLVRPVMRRQDAALPDTQSARRRHELPSNGTRRH